MTDGQWLLIDFFQALVAGLLVGGTYGLMCVGLGIIFGVMRVVNFAQGDFMMLGMYVAYYLVTGFGVLAFLGPYVGPVVGAALAGPVVYVIGWLLHKKQYPDLARYRRARHFSRGRGALRADHPHPRHRARAGQWRPDPVRIHAVVGADAAIT